MLTFVCTEGGRVLLQLKRHQKARLLSLEGRKEEGWIKKEEVMILDLYRFGEGGEGCPILSH